MRLTAPAGVPDADIPSWASQRRERPQTSMPLRPEAAPRTVGGPGSWFTVEQVAEKLQLSAKTIRRLIARGELRAVRFGRSVRLQMPQ